jgi:hypothetical protein
LYKYLTFDPDLRHLCRCCVNTCNEVNIDFVKSIYSMILNTEKVHLLYAIGLVGTSAGKLQSGVKERARGREKRGREGVLLRKGFGIRHKFDSLSNFSEFRDG